MLSHAFASRRLFLAALFLLVSTGLLSAADPAGVKVLRSFEKDETSKRWRWPGHCCYGKFVSDKATHGSGSLLCKVKGGGRHGMAQYVKEGPVAEMKKAPRLMAVPPNNDYHDVLKWYFERYCAVLDDCYSRIAHKPQDWSKCDRLLFDVFAVEAPVILGISVRDATGPRFMLGWTGMRSGTTVFNVPKGKWVTCEFPLAEMARIGELDLTRMIGFFLHRNGYQGSTDYYLDYFRVVSADAEKKSKYEIIKPTNKLTPRLHKVVRTPPLKTIPEKLRRDTGPVEMIGPVVVSKNGTFGALGVTYAQTVRRGVVAYDNKRLLFLSRGGGDKLSRKINPKSDTDRGMYAHATFDGGKTWGGITPGESLPTHLNTWYGRAGASADYATGQVYLVGTENCQSYHGGYDTFFRSLGFTGEKWAPERVSMIDANMQKCPWWSHVLRLDSGRLWAVWCDGRSAHKFGKGGVGFPYKHSDDGGLTWHPSRNGDSSEIPHPFYKPNIKDIEHAHEKAPTKVILWPAKLTTGPMMAHYGKTLIAFSPQGSRYAIQGENGKDWGEWKKVPFFGKTGGHSECTVVSIDKKDIFVSRGGHFGEISWAEKWLKRGRTTMDKLEKKTQTDLIVARFSDGKWSQETFETDGVWDSILTASGKSVFCFYVKLEKKNDVKAWVVYYRRWKDGKWDAAVKVAEDAVRIKRLAAPRRCPPSYAAVLWDHMVMKGEPGPEGISFVRVPNK